LGDDTDEADHHSHAGEETLRGLRQIRRTDMFHWELF
jgi:hypothetical protein